MFSVALKPLIHYLSSAANNGANYGTRAVWLALCVPVISSLVACGGEGEANSSTADLIAGELSLNMPSRIRNINAINPNAVSAVATINNQRFPLTRGNDGRFQTSITVNTNTDISVGVSFSETLPGGANIELASHPAIESNTGNDNLTIQFLESNYETDNFDVDGDGCSNITEREVDTNPLVNDAIPANFVRSISFNIPAGISSLPDQNLLEARVQIVGIGRAAIRIDNSIQSSGALTQCSNSEILVLLRYGLPNNILTIASAIVPHGTSANVVLSESDFDFNEDADGDGITNLTELQSGSNPFVQN